MKVLCKYYSNTIRLLAGISNFSEEQSFRFFCLEGSIVKLKTQFKIVTDEVTVFVSCISKKTRKNLMVILTNMPKYRDMDGKLIDLNFVEYNGIDFTLCKLLFDKFNVTHNFFEVEFASKDATFVIYPDNNVNTVSSLVGCIKYEEAEAIVTGDAAIKNMLNTTVDIKSFSYRTVSNDIEKEVSVRKSRGEIFREIAHYLNRTVVLVSCLDDGRLVEQYISARSVLEVYTKQDGVRFYKWIAPITIKSARPFCIYLTSASVEDIHREQQKSLSKK